MIQSSIGNYSFYTNFSLRIFQLVKTTALVFPLIKNKYSANFITSAFTLHSFLLTIHLVLDIPIPNCQSLKLQGVSQYNNDWDVSDILACNCLHFKLKMSTINFFQNTVQQIKAELPYQYITCVLEILAGDTSRLTSWHSAEGTHILNR